jgi:hypothetical protein
LHWEKGGKSEDSELVTNQSSFLWNIFLNPPTSLSVVTKALMNINSKYILITTKLMHFMIGFCSIKMIYVQKWNSIVKEQSFFSLAERCLLLILYVESWISFFFSIWWDWGLNSGLHASKQAFYCLSHIFNPFHSGYFGDGVS